MNKGKTWKYPIELLESIIHDPTKYTALDHYLGNKLVKRAGCIVNYTDEMKEEYRRCKFDIHYFARKYCKIITLDYGIQKIKPFEWQDELWDKFSENRFNIVMAARQVGKSVAFWVYAAHYAVFNEDKVIAVLANKGATAKKMLAGIKRIIENLPFFLQPGCKEWNKMTVEFETNTRIIAASTSSDSIRGDSVNLLVLEEFAFVKNSAEFMTSTFPVITAGETSKVIIVSTPNGTSNEFYRIWQKSINKQSDYIHSLYTWRCRPERTEEWKKKTIARTNERQFSQEMECNFIGSVDTLISGECLLGLKSYMPISIDSDFSTYVYELPKSEAQYIMTVDVCKGRGKDSSTFTIFDVSNFPIKQVVAYQNNLISPLSFPAIILKWAKQYNNAYVIIENNDQGSLVVNGLWGDLEYENIYSESDIDLSRLGLFVNKKVKAIGTSNLKDMLENGKLIVYDQRTIDELGKFIRVKNSYGAELGFNDDLVQNLWLLSWFASTDLFSEHSGKINLRADMLTSGFGTNVPDIAFIHNKGNVNSISASSSFIPYYGFDMSNIDNEEIEFMKTQGVLLTHRF